MILLAHDSYMTARSFKVRGSALRETGGAWPTPVYKYSPLLGQNAQQY